MRNTLLFLNTKVKKSVNTKVRQAVILAGWQRTKLKPLTKYCQAWMLPVVNRPFIEYTVDFLKNNGIEKIIFTLSESDKDEITTYLQAIKGVDILCHVENRPRGTAGTLKDIEGLIGNEPFLVVNSNLFAGHIDLSRVITFHRETNSILTIGVYRDSRNLVRENINITSDRTVTNFHAIHSSVDRRSPWRPIGIYLFDPSVLELIDHENYMDIKEQLIPILQMEKLKVSTYEVDGFYLNINRVKDYIMIHRDILLDEDNYKRYVNGKEMIGDNIWVGKNVAISPRAYLLGPIVIGDNCTIDSWSQIVGPAVVGNKCRISERALVRESIIWDGGTIEAGSKIEYSVLCENSSVTKGQGFKNVIAVKGVNVTDANLIPLNYKIKGVIDLTSNVFHAGTKYKSYLILRRIMDMSLSAFGLILFIPLFLIIAFAIKIDSPGPVFFMQRRCGKNGREFKMIKFRTMFTNAEKLQKDLIPKNNIDGPMFKLADDPRITKVGEILRKTSLDELPQLFNVFRGEMSLVGPRPLVMDEMRFSPSWRDIRLKVKSGLTGLWQVEGRSEAPFHDWIRYDLHYVRNQSLWLDIKILFKTIKAVLKKAGAY